MRLFIASDIHGSAIYCSQMLNAFERENADKMLLLGDILYHGPRNNLPDEYGPKQVIAMLNERKQDILCVRGNCDTEVDQMVLAFSMMAQQALVYADGYRFIMVHGHKLSGVDAPCVCAGDILLYGHTHVPEYKVCPVDEADRSKGTYIRLNPGSVSIPKENSWHGYILYDGGTFIMKDLSGGIKGEYEIGEGNILC